MERIGSAFHHVEMDSLRRHSMTIVLAIIIFVLVLLLWREWFWWFSKTHTTHRLLREVLTRQQQILDQRTVVSST